MDPTEVSRSELTAVDEFPWRTSVSHRSSLISQNSAEKAILLFAGRLTVYSLKKNEKAYDLFDVDAFLKPYDDGAVKHLWIEASGAGESFAVVASSGESQIMVFSDDAWKERSAEPTYTATIDGRINAVRLLDDSKLVVLLAHDARRDKVLVIDCASPPSHPNVEWQLPCRAMQIWWNADSGLFSFLERPGPPSNSRKGAMRPQIYTLNLQNGVATPSYRWIFPHGLTTLSPSTPCLGLSLSNGPIPGVVLRHDAVDRLVPFHDGIGQDTYGLVVWSPEGKWCACSPMRTIRTFNGQEVTSYSHLVIPLAGGAGATSTTERVLPPGRQLLQLESVSSIAADGSVLLARERVGTNERSRWIKYVLRTSRESLPSDARSAN